MDAGDDDDDDDDDDEIVLMKHGRASRDNFNERFDHCDQNAVARAE